MLYPSYESFVEHSIDFSNAWSHWIETTNTELFQSISELAPKYDISSIVVGLELSSKYDKSEIETVINLLKPKK